MKTIYLITVAIFCIVSSSVAQKENNVWVYGDRSGLDFNSGIPVYIPTASDGREGTASVSDTSGKLLFYADGKNVFDKTNTVMPGSTGLIANSSSSQGNVIVPVNDKQYYIFGVDALEEGRGRFFYHFVDMNLNGGKGDIVAGKKNIILTDSMSEKITVVPTCDGIWVLIHHMNRPEFRAYKVFPSGFIGTPVISVTDGSTGSNHYATGEMEVSNNYTMIALSYMGWWLFSFDSRTGIVGKIPIMTCPDYSYGIEFSPDDSKLYISSEEIVQYDLGLLPSAAAVLASKYLVAGQVPPRDLDSVYFGLRLAPDKKMYFVSFGAPSYISCINEPDKAGAACNVSWHIPSLKHTNTKMFLQLGNNVVRLRNPKTDVSLYSICEEGSLHIPGNGFESFRWNDGDTSGTRDVSGVGKYWRESYRNHCLARIDTYYINRYTVDTVFTFRDTLLCFQPEIMLKGPADMHRYLWQDGDTNRSKIIRDNGLYCVVSKDINCKVQVDSFKVSLVNFELDLKDTTICKDQFITITGDEIPGAEYLWQDGSTKSSITTNLPGNYRLKMVVAGCRKTDSFNITQNILNPDLGTDRVMCEPDSITLSSGVPEAEYLWNTGSRESSLTISVSGNYFVKTKRNGCEETDSVNVIFKQCKDCIGIPNAFSPNGDNKNDLFGPMLSCQVLHYKFIIVNRYGQEVFATDNPAEKWAGTFRNRMEGVGVYYYLIKVRFDYPGAVEELYKGDITLIR